MIRPHPLDVGPPAPDWGQRHDGPRDPDPVVTIRATDPDPDPEPDWDRLRGDEPLRVKTPAPARRTPPDRQKQPQKRRGESHDPLLPSEMPGGLIRRSRERMGSRRGDMESQELRAYYREPKWVLVMKRRNQAHWLWR